MSSNKSATITPFLVVKDGIKAKKFYVDAFEAAVIVSYGDEKLSAHLSIEGASFWIGDEEPEFGNLSPQSIGGSAVRIVLIIADPEKVFNKAIAAGATQICPVTTEESWKIGKLSDPFGHIWEIGHPLSNSEDQQG